MTSVNVRIDKRKLEDLRNRGGSQMVRQALGTLAMEYQKKAGDLMREPKSGRTYDVPGTNVSHVAAAPGEAPGIVTGNLVNSILAQPVGDGSKTWVISVGAEYGGWQEFGTAEMPAHPFMRPSADATRDMVDEVFRKALGDVV